MTTVSNLSVVIGADIGGLNQGLQNAQRGVKNFGNQVGSTSDQMRGFLRNTDGSFIGVGQSISGLNKKMQDLGFGFLPAAGAAALVGVAIKGSIGAAIEFESAFANVAKTVDASDEELAALRGTLRDMATSDSPVGALENSLITLTDIAAAAGQLGVATEDIASFSETMAMLGVATDLTATDAAVFAARFANVTGMSFDNIDELGDMLVTLGNNMATTESEIAGFASRLAPLANYNWDPASILGYSAALSSLGVSAELGGTNLNKSVADMTTAVAVGGPKLQTYAEIAGLTAANFKELAGSDSQAAFQQFITGLANLDADQQILQLNKLGITSVEQITTLQRLAGGLGTLTQSLDLAEEGWAGNNAVLNEAAAKADTTQGKINTLKNNLNELGVAVGELVLPVLNVAVEVTATAIKATADVFTEARKLGENLGSIIGRAAVNAIQGTTVVGASEDESGPIAKMLEDWFIGNHEIVLGTPLEISFGSVLVAADALDGISATVQTSVNGIKPIEATVSTVLSLIAPDVAAILPQVNAIIDELSKTSPTGQNLALHKLYMSTPIAIMPGGVEVMPTGIGWVDGLLRATAPGMAEAAANAITQSAIDLGTTTMSMQFAILPGGITYTPTGIGWVDSSVLSILNDVGAAISQPTTEAIQTALAIGADISVNPRLANGDEMLTELNTQTSTLIDMADPNDVTSKLAVSPTVVNPGEVVSGVQGFLQAQNYDTSVTANVTVKINKFYEDNPEFSDRQPGQQLPVPETDGNHASGLGYVPFDGYMAGLHQGEMVLPRDEARAYRFGGGGRGAVIVNLTNFGGNMQEAAEMIKRAVRDAGI